MLIVMKQDASDQDIERVKKTVTTLGFRPHVMPGKARTSIGITGNEEEIDRTHFENLPHVSTAIRVTKPYKLVSRTFQPTNTTVRIGNASIGGDNLSMIAGPCAVEDRDQVFKVAERIAKSGAQFFRGGAFKPRTSPYAFQGCGEKGLELLADVREEFGLNIVTEAMNEKGIELVEQYGDCIQIGARNMQNFPLLKRAGRSTKPILLKRGLASTLDEFLLAAEYIMSEGNYNVVLCERGIRTFGTHARNTLDLSIVPAVKKISHLPIIVDPSHGTGHTYMVGPLAKASVAVGVDGLIIEVHPCPENALCDGSQALIPEDFDSLYHQLITLHSALNPKKEGKPA